MTHEEHALENAVSRIEAGKGFDRSDINFMYIFATPDEVFNMASWVVYTYKPSVIFKANEDAGDLIGAIMDALSFLRNVQALRFEDYLDDDYWWGDGADSDDGVPVKSMLTKARVDEINYIYDSEPFRKLRDLVGEE